MPRARIANAAPRVAPAFAPGDWRAAWLLVLAISIGGCAGLRPGSPVSGDVAPQKDQRRQDVVRQFEAGRDAAQYQAAQSFLRQGNIKAGRQSIEQLLARNPEHYEARLTLVDLLLDEEEYNAAEEQVRRVLAARPEEARAEHALGVILDAKGQAEEAGQHFARAAKLDPQNETYRLSCQFAAGAALGGPAPAAAVQSKGQVARASATGAAQGDSPAVHQPPLSLGTRQPDPQSGGPGESADSSDLIYRLEAALEEGNESAFRSAVDDLAIFAPHDPQIQIKAAVIALRHERADLAAERAAACIRQFPKSAEAYRVLGTAQYRLGRYRAAQSAFTTALSLDNSVGLSYFLMGCTLKKLDQPEAAATHFARAAELDPRFDGAAAKP